MLDLGLQWVGFGLGQRAPREQQETGRSSLRFG
jgi:hypothetical protein